MDKKESRPRVQKQKGNVSFLNKFRDKHSVISKQGLLNLFQKKRKSLQTKMLKQSNIQSNIQSIPLSSKDKQKSLQQNKIKEIIKTRSLRRGSSQSVSKSVQLSQVTRKPPSIHKSVSTTLNLRQKVVASTVPLAKAQNLPKTTKRVPLQVKQKGSQQNFNFQLDKYALDHLDFLDKFQQRLRKRQPTPH